MLPAPAKLCLFCTGRGQAQRHMFFTKALHTACQACRRGFCGAFLHTAGGKAARRSFLLHFQRVQLTFHLCFF